MKPRLVEKLMATEVDLDALIQRADFEATDPDPGMDRRPKFRKTTGRSAGSPKVNFSLPHLENQTFNERQTNGMLRRLLIS